MDGIVQQPGNYLTEERSGKIDFVLDRRQPDITVILENVNDPHNIFAVIRTCDAVGIGEVHVIRTPMTGHSKMGRASSRGAIDWVKFTEYDSVADCMTAISGRYSKMLATHLSPEGKTATLYELDLTESVALVFGNEQKGVSKELLAHCHGNFIIPMMGMVQSLNISVACAVTLYEALRQRQAKGFYDGERRLGEQEYQQLAQNWKSHKKIRKGTVKQDTGANSADL